MGALGPTFVEHYNVNRHLDVTQKEQVARNYPKEKIKSNTTEMQALNLQMSELTNGDLRSGKEPPPPLEKHRKGGEVGTA